MSKVKLMAATLAVVAFSAVPAVAQDGNSNSAQGGDAVNVTGDATGGDNNIEQNIEDVKQNAEISAGGSNGGQGDNENNINQNVGSIEATQYAGDANTGFNFAMGGDAEADQFIGFDIWEWFASFFD